MKTNYKMKQVKVKLNNLKDKGKLMKKHLETRHVSVSHSVVPDSLQSHRL